MSRQRPASVLFVCGMNAIRSPMAEALARSLYGRDIYVQSAGVEAGQPDGFMAAVMAERGLELGHHEPRTLEEIGDSYFDLIITLSPEAHHHALAAMGTLATTVEYWPTLDPSGVAGTREQVLDAYRQTRDALEARIKRRLAPG